MTNDQIVDREIAIAIREKREFSDLAAKVLANQYHDGTGLTYAFASTGAILCDDTSELWRALFPNYLALTPADRQRASWLGTYLLHRKDRGPVEGWVDLNW